MTNSSRREKIDPIWWAPVLLLVVIAISALTAMLFSGTLRKSEPLTLVSDRSGLVMEDGAKVKLRGVQVGEVTAIGAETGATGALSELQLKIYPEPFKYLPSNLEAEIKSSTAFGAKYVDLIVPADASSERLRPGSVVHSRNVTVEVNTVFQSLQGVIQSIDPAKLNSILSALAESVRGKGEVIGQAITDSNNVLLAVNPRMPTVQQDWRLFGQTAKAYSDAAQNIVSILDSFSMTSTTITANSQALDALLLSSVGFAGAGINTIGGNQPNLVRAMNILDPTTALLMKYSPTYTCLFQGAQWFLENGGRDAIGGNGKSVIMDAALLIGDDPYRYPDNLPIVNASGGPGGKPSCGSLPDPIKNFPVKYLVTDTGFGTGLDLRPNPGIGFPGIANFFPVTKANPEPPRIRYPGGPAPGPLPPYPGAPAYGAPEYGPDGTPLYPPPPGAPPPPAPHPARTAMRKRTIRALVRVGLFTAVCLVFMFVLVTVFGQFRFDATNTYNAVFTNVSGLKGGNFVRIAGVEVGKVRNMTLHKDGTVTVEFAVDKNLTLTQGTKAAVRYENLIGDRYLSLEDGPGSVRKLQPGQTIPLARTSPALDIDALVGGFRPLFRALDPDQVNALSGELLRVFQGQGGTMASVLAQTSTLTSTLAGRDELIGDVIKNLNTVLDTFAERDDQFAEGLDKLSAARCGPVRTQERHRDRDGVHQCRGGVSHRPADRSAPTRSRSS